MEKKLQRDEHNKTIAGVCAGIAEYLSIDVTLVRVLFVLALILHGCGIIPYIILWIVMPKKVYGFNTTGFNNPGPFNYTVPPQTDGPVDYTVPNPFGNFAQPQDAPFAMPPKKRSNAGVIVGVALVAFGSFFLLDNFDLLPDWQFDRLWPLVLVAGGIILVFSRRALHPWEQENWHTTNNDPTTTETKEEDKTEDTPPTV